MHVSGYHGTVADVQLQMSQEHKKARKDQMSRKMAARLRKDLIDQQDEVRVKFGRSQFEGGK